MNSYSKVIDLICHPTQELFALKRDPPGRRQCLPAKNAVGRGGGAGAVQASAFGAPSADHHPGDLSTSWLRACPDLSGPWKGQGCLGGNCSSRGSGALIERTFPGAPGAAFSATVHFLMEVLHGPHSEKYLSVRLLGLL